MNHENTLREKIAAVRDEIAEIEAKASLVGTALRIANERADAARTREAELRKALADLMLFVRESEGLSGYHRNGDIAPWDEFAPEIEAAERALTSGADEP